MSHDSAFVKWLEESRSHRYNAECWLPGIGEMGNEKLRSSGHRVSAER